MAESNELEWGEPPPDARGGAQLFWQEVWKMLRARPGEWAKLPGVFSTATQHQIKNGSYAGTVAGEFECTARKAPGAGSGSKGRKYHLWVRYVGHLPAEVLPGEAPPELERLRGPQVGDTGAVVK
jgi:hypothetical protein